MIRRALTVESHRVIAGERSNHPSPFLIRFVIGIVSLLIASLVAWASVNLPVPEWPR